MHVLKAHYENEPYYSLKKKKIHPILIYCFKIKYVKKVELSAMHFQLDSFLVMMEKKTIIPHDKTFYNEDHQTMQREISRSLEIKMNVHILH